LIGFIVQQLYISICILLLAGKDSDSYQLKDKTDNALSSGRIKRWHRDGAILFALFFVPFIHEQGWQSWKICVAGIMLRLIIFDPLFNEWSGGVSMSYLGGTAFADKIFIKIFGINGAIKKSLFFLILLIIFNVLIWRIS